MSVYRLFSEHVQQLGRNRATMDMEKLDIAAKSYDHVLDTIIYMATPEQRINVIK